MPGFTQAVARLTPQLPARAYRTFQIISPPDLTLVIACKQAGCSGWRNGWQTIVDETSPLGREQADYIRRLSGRTFREQKTGAERLTVFIFPPYQRCFREHRTRPEKFIAKGGDWRGNPTGEHRVHQSAANWVEDFALHQIRLTEAIARG
jgi:hypothetical protein